jgi:HPt (histidine-containing phosphotransfer) domain-containing protein
VNNQSLSNAFVFNENFDNESLFNLYADDFEYIEEIFSITLKNFDPDFESIQVAWSSEDPADLKRAIHKIKPAFGFVGLTTIQDQCRDFEDLCQTAMTTKELSGYYKQIVTTLADSKKLLETEYRRLKEFNANHPI